MEESADGQYIHKIRIVMQKHDIFNVLNKCVIIEKIDTDDSLIYFTIKAPRSIGNGWESVTHTFVIVRTLNTFEEWVELVRRDVINEMVDGFEGSLGRLLGAHLLCVHLYSKLFKVEQTTQ